MATIHAVLTKIIDYSFPTFGAFELIQLSGEVVVINEKLSVIGVDYVDGKTRLPLDVMIECTVVSTSNGTVIVDTSEPFAIEDVKGRTQFRVAQELVEL